ncbi:ankyrin repeat domain-containing protein SOWAHA [Brachionichthys hirsutus]|uniref:ankyrin repeat domain-containing protein SOWAHA n=1 Tax=Brachionichthys hirsutus TaxID=412623 RepID=UPI0036050089
MALTQESILSFLLQRGGEARNSELLRGFRSLIGGSSDPEEQQRSRELFKELVNSVAVVRQVDRVKFVVVKKRYQDFVREEAHAGAHAGAQRTRGAPHPAEPARRIYHSGANPVRCDDAEPEETTQRSEASRARKPEAAFAVVAAESPPPRDPAAAAQGRPPAPPHRNKTLDKPVRPAANVSTPSLQNLNFQAGKKGVRSVSPQGWKSRQTDNAPQAPGSPLARAPQKSPKQGDESFSDGVPLEPSAHQWLVKCAAGQWGQVYGLLLQDPRLAHRKDFMSGFTALHWAAKDGDCRMMRKLMGVAAKGGPLGVGIVNSKAHGGHTPLHIAAMHGRHDATVLIVQKYGADVTQRDNDGKKAIHYLGAGAPAEVRALLGRPQQQQQQGEKEERAGDEECREHSKGLATFGRLFQPHAGKKPKPAATFARDW